MLKVREHSSTVVLKTRATVVLKTREHSSVVLKTRATVVLKAREHSSRMNHANREFATSSSLLHDSQGCARMC